MSPLLQMPGSGQLRQHTTPPPGPSAAPAGVFPLSSMQESLWVIEQISPGNSAYNLADAWRFQGSLDTAALKQSLDEMARRHESLRTVFGSRDGRPVQIVRQPESLCFQQAVVTSTAELPAHLEAEARRPFDFTRGPLARAVLYQLSGDDHVLLICMHHIISDEWSFGIFMRELAELYTARLHGKPAELPELPIQYADFTVWQRDLVAEGRLESQVRYWSEKLRGPLPSVTLPYDKRPPRRRSLNGKTQFSTLPAELVEALKELSRRQSATLFMTLLAAFDTLLHRYSRQTDIIIGTPIAGRERMETENLVGFFVNTHAVRSDLSGDPTFIELLGRVREDVLGAYAHQGLQLDKVVEAARAERHPAGHPLFQVIFGLQPPLTQSWTMPGLSHSHIELDNGGAKFDWTLLATEVPEGVALRSEFNSELFDPASMERVSRHFITLLRSIRENPAARISQLRVLTDSEKQELLSAGNTTSPRTSNRIHGESLQGIFEAQAARTPEAQAVVFENERVSYRELNQKANQLAHHLTGQGVGPETPVALYLERSLDLVIGILATLKAGGCYVPIDPANPQERLSFMLEDTKALVIVSVERLRSKLPAQTTARIICLDSDRPIIAKHSSENPPARTLPDHSAYIIYTSGSTGRPKGVVVTHHNVVRLFQQTEACFDFGSNDVWTLFHSYTFDFSVWELWGAMLYGGKLVVVPYLVTRSPKDFYELLLSEKVTVLNQTPSAFRQLIWAEASSGTTAPLSLRYVICGGEALELQSLKPWFERHGDQRPIIVNMYGITETTVHVTYRVIRAEDLNNNLGSVIGVPIPDLKLYLLDEHLQPVPAGVSGEICVSGAGVARGYLNRAELTEARFVTDPFSNQPGAKMYRSGDLARRTANGELEYLGRMDHQVKIRGFRVELGEIESALNAHPAIRESIVLADKGPAGDKRLIAYIVPATTTPDPAEVTKHLRQRLPDYMVPSIIMPLDTLPLTVNGKVDRRALPAPASHRMSTQSLIAPRTEAEKSICAIWCNLLGREALSVEDNFFHLGGHSLLAIQIIARIEAAFQIELSVMALFENPTVAGLAHAVEKTLAEQSHPRAAIRRRMEAEKAEELLARLDELTDEQVEQLLGESSSKPLCS